MRLSNKTINQEFNFIDGKGGTQQEQQRMITRFTDMMKLKAIFSVTRMLSQTDQQTGESKTERIILAFAVLVSCLLLGYFTSQATKGYLDPPTTLEFKTEELDQFPKISLFLRNIINGSKVESVGLTKLHIKYLLATAHNPGWLLTAEDDLELDNSNVSILGKDINEVCRAHNFTRPELLEYVKYDWNDLVGILPNLSTDERARMEYRVNVLRLTMAKEWQYNDSQTKRERLPMLEFWFKDLAEETPYIQHKRLFGSSAVVDFVNPDSFSMKGVVKLVPNISTEVDISMERITLLNRPNNPCRPSGGSYSSCIHQCWSEITECQYDCKWWSKELEDLMEHKFCRNRWFNELSKHSCYKIHENCTDRCSIPPCEYLQFTTQTQYPDIESSNRTNVTVSLQWGWRLIVHENKYTMSWIDYTSNVAGLVGMFFGGSVVTIICFCCSWFMRTWVQGILKYKKHKVPEEQATDVPDVVMHV